MKRRFAICAWIKKKKKTGKDYFKLMRTQITCNTQAVTELSIVDEYENNT